MFSVDSACAVRVWSPGNNSRSTQTLVTPLLQGKVALPDILGYLPDLVLPGVWAAPNIIYAGETIAWQSMHSLTNV